MILSVMLTESRVTGSWPHKATTMTSSSLVKLQIAEERGTSRFVETKNRLFKLQLKIYLLKLTLVYFWRDFISCLLQLFRLLVK